MVAGQNEVLHSAGAEDIRSSEYGIPVTEYPLNLVHTAYNLVGTR